MKNIVIAAGYATRLGELTKNDKVKCRKIEQMMPQLMKMVESEMEGMSR